MLCADNEDGAEIYGCANDRQQAGIVFEVAKDMVLQSPILLERIKIVESQKRLVYMPTRSIYQALSTDPAGNLKIDKEKSTEKVDGAVALVMALDRALKNQGMGGSVYDSGRGLLFI